MDACSHCREILFLFNVIFLNTKLINKYLCNSSDGPNCYAYGHLKSLRDGPPQNLRFRTVCAVNAQTCLNCYQIFTN